MFDYIYTVREHYLLVYEVVVALNHEVLSIQLGHDILLQLFAALELEMLLHDRLVLGHNLLYVRHSFCHYTTTTSTTTLSIQARR